MSEVVLYDYWRSSASYRVRIALNLAGVAYRSVTVDLVKGEQVAPEHLARNPQGFVPVLDIDGAQLTQSLAILEYLDRTRGLNLLPEDPLAHAKAQALAEQIGAGATTGAYGAAPTGDIVILAVPYAAVLDVVKQYGEKLAGKLLVDITNPIKSDFTGFLTPEDSFGAREIAKVAPAATVIVKAFNTQNSNVLAAGPVEGRTLDIFLAGDDAQAKARVSAFIDSLGLRPMDTGPLTMARTLEHACMLWLGLMTHSGKHTSPECCAAVEDVPESSTGKSKKPRAAPPETKKVSVKEDGTGGDFTISSTLDGK